MTQDTRELEQRLRNAKWITREAADALRDARGEIEQLTKDVKALKACNATFSEEFTHCAEDQAALTARADAAEAALEEMRMALYALVDRCNCDALMEGPRFKGFNRGMIAGRTIDDDLRNARRHLPSS